MLNNTFSSIAIYTESSGSMSKSSCFTNTTTFESPCPSGELLKPTIRESVSNIFFWSTPLKIINSVISLITILMIDSILIFSQSKKCLSNYLMHKHCFSFSRITKIYLSVTSMVNNWLKYVTNFCSGMISIASYSPKRTNGIIRPINNMFPYFNMLHRYIVTMDTT